MWKYPHIICQFSIFMIKYPICRCNYVTDLEKSFITRLGCFYVTAILSWGYGWGWVEAEVDLNLRLKWDWDEIEWKFSWNWVEVELSWGWDMLTLTKGRNWAFIGLELWFQICFRSNHIAKQHMFYMCPSIFAINFI